MIKFINRAISYFKKRFFGKQKYDYDILKYSDTFLAENSLLEDRDFKNEKINRVIYVFWTGTNSLTPNRLAGLKSLEDRAGIEVKLVTPQNLKNYIKEEDPLPEAYQYLSLNHKSDYLRSYFMHHYGGGYADIKTYFHSWKQAFEQLENSDAYIIGYPEIGEHGIASVGIKNKALKRDLKYNLSYLVGNGAFICRAYTKFTDEWHNEAKRRLEANASKLKSHPATDFFGENRGYPLKWAYMQGEIFHPLCFKYHEKVLSDTKLQPSFTDYR